MSEKPAFRPAPYRGLIIGLVLAMTSGPAIAAELAEGHPERYTVQRGDTLWDIAGMFLQEPWLWPEIWNVNPQIENPHLIYPGDVIRLTWVDGEPQLVLERGEPEPDLPVTRLSPEVRERPLETVVQTVAIDDLRPFLTRPSVVDKAELEGAPYVLSTTDGKLMAAEGDDVFVRNAGEVGEGYRIVQLGDAYRDPETNDLLGYEALHVGEGVVTKAGDPAMFRVVSGIREVRNGQRLLPSDLLHLDHNFQPSAPDMQVQASIIAVVDGIAQVGKNQVVVINLGTDDGVMPGNTLSVWQTGSEVSDPYKSGGSADKWYKPNLLDPKVQLPETQAGELLVFRVSDNISYALVTESARAIRIGDIVRNP